MRPIHDMQTDDEVLRECLNAGWHRNISLAFGPRADALDVHFVMGG